MFIIVWRFESLREEERIEAPNAFIALRKYFERNFYGSPSMTFGKNEITVREQVGE